LKNNRKKIKILFAGLGRSVLRKTVPSVLSTALGLRPRAVLTLAQFFSIRTSRPANNIYILCSVSDINWPIESARAMFCTKQEHETSDNYSFHWVLLNRFNWPCMKKVSKTFWHLSTWVAIGHGTQLAMQDSNNYYPSGLSGNLVRVQTQWVLVKCLLLTY